MTVEFRTRSYLYDKYDDRVKRWVALHADYILWGKARLALSLSKYWKLNKKP